MPSSDGINGAFLKTVVYHKFFHCPNFVLSVTSAKFATSVKRGAVEGRERHRVNAVRVEGVGSAVSFSAYPQQRMGRNARARGQTTY